METLKLINYIIALVFFICYAYQFLYILIPFFKREKAHKEAVMHRYAVLICARNEEAVISELIKSLKAQTYPSELIDIYVCADNCTDDTASVARESGAAVIERFDERLVGKGYALNHLISSINSDCHEKYDGYFVFDADNVLEPDFIEQMNRTFSDGYRIVTSYRNSKNYGDNWVSAGYALWFLRESRYLNHARHLIGTSCAVSGTGFMFSAELVKDGWQWFLLTEDIQFSVDSILKGEKIGFCKDAVLYDEQPTRFSQSVRQRKRWARGYLQVFSRHGLSLIRGIFSRRGWSCFDMASAIMPAMILSLLGFAVNLTAFVIYSSDFECMKAILLSAGQSALSGYMTLFVIGFITTLSEWKHIHTHAVKKLLYSFTFPIFMFTYIPISILALFGRVTWKPIAHTEKKDISQIKQN